MARHAQDTWLKLIAGDDHLVKESIRKSLTEMRNELEEPGASRLEKLLIERIVACWLQVQFAEINVATSANQPLPQQGSINNNSIQPTDSSSLRQNN